MTTEGEEFLGVKKQDSSGGELGKPPLSAWAVIFYLFGIIGVIASVINLIALDSEEVTLGHFVISAAITLQMFFAGFIVEVLTDMRRYLKTLAKREK